ncbi:hypothetical protein HNQ94_003379 [Salirhabdus euzebyi]|uniref:Inner membrane protein YgaP-like transmembrane domain-containing protein n=1 Tax=Salirhabdus euzebyi TaxID=394506 RepID=A0A841Q914_9BACI|nr:DUF2892 domain-containing protein [Salirhabdus euzebyi]MBB6454890.1 hypothetical protein [Salirhabdus euzebyi]
MIKQNIGILNALIRITCGLTFLCYGVARLIKRPERESNSIIIMLSAMKVAEGIVRYCPVTDMIDRSNVVKEATNLAAVSPNQTNQTSTETKEEE